jgi:hypothetical protein
LTSIVTVRPFGPFSVTVPASLSTAATVPRTFVTDAAPFPVGFSAGAGALSAGAVVVGWAKAGDWVRSMELAISTAVSLVVM